MTCPVCNCYYSDMYKYIDCDDFDGSYLYKSIHIVKCNSCGHLYNELEKAEIRNLKLYYEKEYAPTNLSSEDGIVDLPGTDNYASLHRYAQVYEFIMDYINKESQILDIGCAMGGFLRFLRRKGYKNLYGIEPIEDYVNKTKDLNIKVGDVYSIPFDDNSFDIVILDQVLEHLPNLKLAMKEIRRVLKKGGLCYIGVPDSERYDNIYWYLMREHIQHFNLTNLKLLGQLNGFELINSEKNESDMIGSLKLQNLAVLLKVRGNIYCWGIGREFMYYHHNTRLRNLDLILVDDTPMKQKRTFQGAKIYTSDVLKEAPEDSFLIITATIHKEALKKKALELGFKGEIIDV